MHSSQKTVSNTVRIIAESEHSVQRPRGPHGVGQDVVWTEAVMLEVCLLKALTPDRRRKDGRGLCRLISRT